MTAPAAATGLRALVGIVGFLAFVEFTSGILQGYYTPMLTDIARHLGVHDADVNWLEGSQLMLSALVVPAFAKLGDMVGHKRMLLVSTAATALASLAMPFTDSFAVFLVAWALQGFYVVWLPLEVALIWIRARRLAEQAGVKPASVTAKAAGVLVASLELGAIGGALLGGALIDTLPLLAGAADPRRRGRHLLLRHPVRRRGVAGSRGRRVRHRRPHSRSPSRSSPSRAASVCCASAGLATRSRGAPSPSECC